MTSSPFGVTSTPPPGLRVIDGGRLASTSVLPLPPLSTATTAHQCVVRGHVFTAVDTPGRPAFRHSWYEQLASVCCIVMVVDCSDWDSLALAAEQVRRLSGKEGAYKVSESSLDSQLGKLPVLVLGNKRDLCIPGQGGVDDEREVSSARSAAKSGEVDNCQHRLLLASLAHI